MWVCSWLLVFGVLLFAGVLPKVECGFDNRIIGGNVSDYGTFEFLPYLGCVKPAKKIDKNSYGKLSLSSCSATVISKRHILAAAHCYLTSDNVNGNPMHRRMTRYEYMVVDHRFEKERRINDFKKAAVATQIYYHATYNPRSFVGDIAIIEFPEGVDMKIEPIWLINDYEPKDNTTAVAAGYGVTHYDNKGAGIMAKELMNATVPVFGFTDKKGVPKKCQYVKPYHICTGDPKLRALQGDSGGPLMLNYNETFYQVGVTSHTSGDINNAGQTFYLPLKDYCGWIEMVTKGEVKCHTLADAKKNAPQYVVKTTVSTLHPPTTSSRNQASPPAHAHILCIILAFIYYAVL